MINCFSRLGSIMNRMYSSSFSSRIKPITHLLARHSQVQLIRADKTRLHWEGFKATIQALDNNRWRHLAKVKQLRSHIVSKISLAFKTMKTARTWRVNSNLLILITSKSSLLGLCPVGMITRLGKHLDLLISKHIRLIQILSSPQWATMFSKITSHLEKTALIKRCKVCKVLNFKVPSFNPNDRCLWKSQLPLVMNKMNRFWFMKAKQQMKLLILLPWNISLIRRLRTSLDSKLRWTCRTWSQEQNLSWSVGLNQLNNLNSQRELIIHSSWNIVIWVRTWKIANMSCQGSKTSTVLVQSSGNIQILITKIFKRERCWSIWKLTSRKELLRKPKMARWLRSKS